MRFAPVPVRQPSRSQIVCPSSCRLSAGNAATVVWMSEICCRVRRRPKYVVDRSSASIRGSIRTTLRKRQFRQHYARHEPVSQPPATAAEKERHRNPLDQYPRSGQEAECPRRMPLCPRLPQAPPRQRPGTPCKHCLREPAPGPILRRRGPRVRGLPRQVGNRRDRRAQAQPWTGRVRPAVLLQDQRAVQCRRKGNDSEIIGILFYTGRAPWHVPGSERWECGDLTCLRQGRHRIEFRRRTVTELPYAMLSADPAGRAVLGSLAAHASILCRAIPRGGCSRIRIACRRATQCGR